MPSATLIINQPGHATREIELSDGVVSIGRALDNTLCLDGDTNVSRYHAVIEAREDGFWLSDLGSSNGTTLNDMPVESERQLKDGDLISVGGASTIDVLLNQTPPQQSKAPDSVAPGPLPVEPATAPDVAAAAPAPSVPAQSAPAGPSPILLIAGVSTGLLLTAVVAIFLISKFSSPCQGAVRILSPQTGSTIRGPVPIRVEAEGTKCIERVSFQLDGNEFASAEASPYDVMLNPTAVPGLSGGNHVLSVLVEDESGKKKIQEETVLLAFDTGSDGKSYDDGAPDVKPTTDQQSSDARSTSTVSAFDTKDMCSRLAKQISGKSDYVYDREFIQQVQTRTGEYLGGGFYARALPFRDVINDTFINEQGLPPPLGYVMAMSRSQFNLAKNQPPSAAGSSGEGLWQVPLSLAQGAGYIGRCGSATPADPDQKCAALVASAYTKALVVDLFAGDFLYATACFGMTPKEAGQWRDGLPADRRDFWKVIKSNEQRDRVVRFFAAGIVGENPLKFGLTKDRPLSNLYPKK